MGRFTSVQTYTDTSADKRTLSYDQARGSSTGDQPQKQQQQLTTEKVINPYGSTAGAGSGEFHMYRQARTREMIRQAALQQTAEEETDARAFALQVQRNEQECKQRTEKRRMKRQKQKNTKARKRNLEQAGIVVVERQVVIATEDDDEDEEEFSYIPEKDQLEETKDDENDDSTKTETLAQEAALC